jgi:DNA polymerase III epsilon subunit
MNRTIAFDVETTGLEPAQGAMILEIGAVSIVNDRISVEDGFEKLVNPGIHIPDEITAINGITDDMVRDAPSVETVLPEFLHFVRDCPLVAHNAPFDVGFINHALISLGMAPLHNPVIDTLSMSRSLFPRCRHHSLDHVLNRLNIPYTPDQRHRSSADARLTAQAYLKLRDFRKRFDFNPSSKRRRHR